MIRIKKSPTADTRSATVLVDKETLLKSSMQHIGDVQQAIDWMIHKLTRISSCHDWTKISFIDEFYDNFNTTQQIKDLDFKKLGWFEKHVTKERHHVNDYCPEDVNLFDLLERVADITVAGMARTGTIYDDELSPDILVKAYKNTVKLLKENIEIMDEVTNG